MMFLLSTSISAERYFFSQWVNNRGASFLKKSFAILTLDYFFAFDLSTNKYLYIDNDKILEIRGY